MSSNLQQQQSDIYKENFVAETTDSDQLQTLNNDPTVTGGHLGVSGPQGPLCVSCLVFNVLFLMGSAQSITLMTYFPCLVWICLVDFIVTVDLNRALYYKLQHWLEISSGKNTD